MSSKASFASKYGLLASCKCEAKRVCTTNKASSTSKVNISQFMLLAPSYDAY